VLFKPLPHTRIRIGVFVLVASITGAFGCKRAPEPEPTSRKPSSGSSEVSSAPRVAPGSGGQPSLPPVEVSWEDPPEWNKPPPKNTMRKANYVVPRAKADKEDGELVVFYFGPGEGGDIEKNVARWLGQYSETPPDGVKRSDRNANGLLQHTVEIESGTYSSGMPGDDKPKAGYGLLGAIVEAPSGNYFFKLVGPVATVKGARSAFYRLLDSIKPGTSGDAPKP
jgi:hypothetical protein